MTTIAEHSRSISERFPNILNSLHQFELQEHKMTKSKLTTAEAKDLKDAGYVEGQPNTIPENVSPVIKAKLLEEHREKEGLVAAQDQPTAIEVGNQLARERAAADGDKDMQKLLKDQQADADKVGEAKAEPKADAQPVQKQNTSGAIRQGDINK